LDRIKGILAELVDLDAQQICDRLLETLQAYQSGSKQDDDVTLVAIRVATTRPARSPTSPDVGSGAVPRTEVERLRTPIKKKKKLK